MDLQPIHHQEANTSSSASTSTRTQLPDLDSSSSTDSRALRTSARVKAAKQKSQAKGKGKERDSTNLEQPSSSTAVQSPDPVVSRAIRATPRTKRSREVVVDQTKTNETFDETITRSSKR